MPQSNARQRSSAKRTWIPVTILVVVIVAAGIGTYAVLNDGRMPWTTKAEVQAKAQEDRAGKKAYPRALREVPAFTAVTLEHLVDEKGEARTVWLEPEKAAASGLLETSAVLGRVTKGTKRPGYGFTEHDFLPKGSPASRTAAIPSGMTGVQITAAQIPTLRGLNANDRFILVAAADPYKGALAPRGSAIAPDVERRTAEERAFQAMTRRIVEGGVVIVAMTDAKATSKDPAFIAVPMAQYADLLSALNNQIEITALAESSNPTVAAVPLPDPVPPAPVERITIQNGDKQQTTVLPVEPTASNGDGR